MRAFPLGLAAVGALTVLSASVMAAGEAPSTLQKSFSANKVMVDGFRGTITITTAAPGSPVTVRASGNADYMKRLDVRQGANGVIIEYQSSTSGTWWPWSALDWSQNRNDEIVMTIGAPKGTEFDMDAIVGRVSAGDLDAPLRFGGAGGGSAKFGNVTKARLEVAGSMDVVLGNSQGPVDVEVAGSGSVRTGSAAKVHLELAGSAEFQSGALAGGLDVDMAGSGDAKIESVNGPVSLDLSGSTSVSIKSGRAEPFKVSIAGSGDVNFGGEAVNPEVSIAGSGSVTVGSMSGSLKQDIHGSGEFIVKASIPGKPAQPTPPTPPAPPAAPEHPAPPQ